MKREQELIKRQLEEELGNMRFTREEEVLRRTHPRSWHDRLKVLWNKEIEVPILPLGVGTALLLVILMINQLGDDYGKVDAQQRQLIEAGGNTYWKDDYEKAVGSVEGDPKS